MKLIVDTSAYSTFNRGTDNRLRQWFNSEHTLVIPMVVIGELRAGFAVGARQAENEQLMQHFLGTPNVNIATITNRTTEHFATLYAAQRKKGQVIGVGDLWIAATALELDMPLLTLDSDFTRIESLELVRLG
jgi:tRNA(fMet)-specific endonuclease VapC